MHIILYVLDALRADHLGCFGYERETSPNVDALAKDGIAFESCFTASTWTRPVAASLLTGTYPGVHRTRTRYDTFSTNLVRLPEVLRAARFKTGFFSTMGNVASEIGFGRGFDLTHDLFLDPAILAKRRRVDAGNEGLMHALDEGIALPRAEDINDHLLPWLDRHREEDTFSFVWSIETHVPYAAPEAFRCFASAGSKRANEGERHDIRRAGAADRQRLMDLYDDEIRYNDDCFGRIIEFLKASSIYESSLLTVVGDHGDAFYEHGFYAHGNAPYDELIHVPMVMKLPEGRHAGRRVSDLVELVDVFPTLVAAAGLESKENGELSYIQGHNLLPLVEGEQESVREFAFSETQALDFHNQYASVRTREWKFIERRKPKHNRRTLREAVRHIWERRMLLDIVRHFGHFGRSYFGGSNESLFNLKSDPEERIDLSGERPDKIGEFRSVLAEWRARNQALAEEVGTIPYAYEESETVRRHLEELGYM